MVVVNFLLLQEAIGSQARKWKVLTTRAAVKEKYRGAMGFLERIRSLVEDVRFDMLTLEYMNDHLAPTCLARHLHLEDQRSKKSCLPSDPSKVKFT